jgi:hypothetical protein
VTVVAMTGQPTGESGASDGEDEERRPRHVPRGAADAG